MPTSTEKRVGVIGSDSFLGTHVVPALEARGFQPVRIVDYASGRSAQGDRLYDPLDADSFAEALSGLPVAIEASSWVPFGLDVPRAKGVAVRRARALMAALGQSNTARCVVVSELATLGDPAEADAASFHVPGSSSNAAIEAAYAFQLELYRGIGEGLDIPLILPAMMVGPGDHDRECSMITGIREGDLPVLPTGSVEIVDVRDLARVVATAVESGRSGRRYPVSAGQMKIGELANLVAERLGGDGTRVVDRPFPASMARGLELGLGLFGRPIALEAPLRHIRKGRVRDSKARGELSFVARPLRETIAEALEWYEQAFGWTA